MMARMFESIISGKPNSFLNVISSGSPMKWSTSFIASIWGAEIVERPIPERCRFISSKFFWIPLKSGGGKVTICGSGLGTILPITKRPIPMRTDNPKNRIHLNRIRLIPLHINQKGIAKKGHARNRSHLRSFCMVAMTVRTMAAAREKQPQNRPRSYQGTAFSRVLTGSWLFDMELRSESALSRATEICFSIRAFSARSIAL